MTQLVFIEFMNSWENLYNMYSAWCLAHIPDIGTSWIGLKYSSEFKKFRWVDSRFVNVSYQAQFPYAILYYVESNIDIWNINLSNKYVEESWEATTTYSKRIYFVIPSWRYWGLTLFEWVTVNQNEAMSSHFALTSNMCFCVCRETFRTFILVSRMT